MFKIQKYAAQDIFKLENASKGIMFKIKKYSVRAIFGKKSKAHAKNLIV